MNRSLAALLASFLAAAIPSGAKASTPLETPGAHHRARDVLASRCISCHGPEKQKGNLRLDSREAALRGGDLGPSLVPGDPDRSLLLQSVRHTHPELEMPPKDPLAPAEIATLETWIRSGAPWPESPVHPPTAPNASVEGPVGDAWTDPRNPIVRLFAGQRLDLWSLRPVRTEALPPPVAFPASSPATAPEPGTHPVDRWVRARLADAGLTPAPPADRRTLARRAALDLTGLPPSAADLASFLEDHRAGAWERYLDRLLASPRFGEHQARLWLDVIRYSDSNGFDWDEYRPEAWRFRDYVVRAFNADKPFDAFIREQLAGDELLDGGPPRDTVDQDRLIATGYLRLGPQDNSAPLFNEQARARAEWMADLTETTASAFLAVTLSCCRCHDHKFDPFSQADHFRLRAFFEPLRYGDDLSLDLAPDHAAIVAQHDAIRRSLQPLEKERGALLETVRTRVRDGRLAALDPGLRGLLTPTVGPLPDAASETRATEAAGRLQPSEDEVRKAFTAEERERHRGLDESVDRLRQSRRPFTRGLLATDATEAVPATRILFQGDHRAERDAVPPGFLSALDPNPAEIPRARNPHTTGRRLALAQWIAAPGNPLTARVFVNRAWQSLFGRGLVATPNDFGLAGARPTHPELLDWLAADFTAHGWSVKRLLRRIATSATYRQSTVHPDPDARAMKADRDNTLVWRQNLRRLTGEQLRDTLLATAGLLQFPDGGRAVWPELPADILQANPAFLDDNAEKTKGWYPSPPERRTARSLYLVQKRTVRVPFLETFDLPDNGTSCPRRTESIVAPQALSLLNGPDALQAIRGLAERAQTEAGPDPDRQIGRLYALALQRAPTVEEHAACRQFLGRQPLTQLARALLNLNEFAFVD